jgi:hypothetical protein
MNEMTNFAELIAGCLLTLVGSNSVSQILFSLFEGITETSESHVVSRCALFWQFLVTRLNGQHIL